MTKPFPTRIKIPQGLVRLRMVWGLPTLTVAGLALVIVGPLLLWGRKALWIMPLAIAVAWWLALESKDDPDFLRTWSGELKLKGRYR